MAQPRPHRNNSNLAQRIANEQHYTAPEISIIVHPEALKQFEGPHLEYMRSFFGSILFENWVRKNMELTEADQRALEIGRFDADEYYRLAKDFRLLQRVWTDLLQMAKDNKPNQSA